MQKAAAAIAAAALLMVGQSGLGMAQPRAVPPPSWACDEVVPRDHSLYGIVEEIFHGNRGRLQSAGLLPDGFAESTAGASFHICNNRSYDTFVLYSDPPVVIFDLQMLGFMFAQSRAMVLGQYVAEQVGNAGTFDLHEKLMQEFADQSDALESDILQIMSREAQRRGVTGEFLTDTLQDSDFARREQETFLHAVRFLTLHELCHVSLAHGTDEARRRGPGLELDADRCAVDIINRDEARFRSSPMSFFGVSMTISTQIIVNEVTRNTGEQRHPSTRERLRHAGNQVFEFLATSGSPDADAYAAVIAGTLDYLDNLIARLAGR